MKIVTQRQRNRTEKGVDCYSKQLQIDTTLTAKYPRIEVLVMIVAPQDQCLH